MEPWVEGRAEEFDSLGGNRVSWLFSIEQRAAPGLTTPLLSRDFSPTGNHRKAPWSRLVAVVVAVVVVVVVVVELSSFSTTCEAAARSGTTQPGGD